MSNSQDEQTLSEIRSASHQNLLSDEEVDDLGRQINSPSLVPDQARLWSQPGPNARKPTELLLPPSQATSELATMDKQVFDAPSSPPLGCCAQPALPDTYHVWYGSHKLRYTIRICRRPTIPSASSSLSASPPPSPTKKRQSVVNILEGPADLTDFDIPYDGNVNHLTENSGSGNASLKRLGTSSTVSSVSPSVSSIAQLKMRQSLLGGWRVRIIRAAGDQARFRARADLTSIKAWRDHAYRWSEDATGKVVARSGLSVSTSSPSPSRSRFRFRPAPARGKPYMRFTADFDDANDTDTEAELNQVAQQQTQDDLVACWTAWLWAVGSGLRPAVPQLSSPGRLVH